MTTTAGGSRSTRRPARVGRPPGPRRDPSVRRREHVDAAIAAIRRIGPTATMAEIADEAGISKPVLYDHFGDRWGLTVAVVERLAEAVATNAVSGLMRGGEPVVLIGRAIDAFVAGVDEEQELYRWVLRGVSDLPSSLGELPAALAAGTQMAMVVGTALRAAGADSGPAEPWAFGIAGFVFGATEWWLTRRTMRREEFVTYLAKFVWAGLQSQGIEQLDVRSVLAALPGAIQIAQTSGAPEEASA